ncbi:MAG: ABC transporter permease [Desulfovibrionaceae bacterium]
MHNWLIFFRQVFAIARKELLVLMGKPKSRFMVLIPPVVQIFVFGFAATMEVKNVDVLIYQQDTGIWSAEIISRLRGSPTFRHITFADSPAHIEQALNTQEDLLVLAFQADFSRTIEKGDPATVQILLDGRRSNAAQIVTSYVQHIVGEVGRSTPLGQASTRAQVQTQVLHWFNPNLNFRWFIVPNLIGMINFIMGMLVTGLTVARERELGTFDQMLVSPARPLAIAVGKLLPGCLIGLAHGTIFLFAAYVCFEIPFVGSAVILYAAMLLFSLSASSMGLMVSSFASTQQQAFLGAFTVAVPCILLSGFMTPINNMPAFLQYLSQINPLRHFIVITQGVFLKDISLAAAWDSGSKIAAIALVSAVLAVWMFKRRA